MRVATQLLWALVAVFAVHAAAVERYSYREMGRIAFTNPAQVEIIQLSTKARPWRHSVLAVTTFSAVANGELYFLDDPGSKLKTWGNGSEEFVRLGEFLWPNFVEDVPQSVSENALILMDGFLVPGKSTGGVWIIPGADGEFEKPIKISTDKKGWFYHNSTFVDMNGDGKLDVLTARATKPIFGQSGGELIWLENPGSLHLPWKEHVITKGPDVIFQIAEIDGNEDTLDLVATQFFSAKLMAYFINLKDLSDVKSVLIDDSIGAAYNVIIEDLNKDGKLELLVNNHEHDHDKAAIFAYEIPTNPLTEKWIRHTILDEIVTLKRGLNEAAPGFTYTFYPRMNATHEKPHILIAGDGAENTVLLRPTEQDFVYTCEEVINVGGVVGSLAIGDVDGDGFVEFFVPDYDNGHIFAFSFGPESSSDPPKAIQ